ncbi:MAG: hypothetical protein JW959_11490 [Pirellulales bacterium]|nr:hypothetical protein [Pirellulales bacterium]
MKKTDSKHSVLRIVVITTTPLGASLILPLLVVPVFLPWSPINCRHEEINIKTGQARHSRYIWCVCVYKVITDTPLFIALQGEKIDVAYVEPWHLANTFSPGARHSPHYRFHAALHQAKWAGQIFEMTEASPEKKREIAETILKLWQRNGNYHEADKYLGDFEKQMTEKASRRTRRGTGG